MSRIALHPRVRDEILKLLFERIRADRSKIKATISAGVCQSIALTTTSEGALLLLTGAIFGSAAELELARLVEWTAADRVPRGEQQWLNLAAARAEYAAHEEKLARLLQPKVQP